MKRIEKSKELFQRYCESLGYSCRQLEESKTSGVRTPDLEILSDALRVIAECKDLVANEEDIRN
jgi:hypothetical protein